MVSTITNPWFYGTPLGVTIRNPQYVLGILRAYQDLPGWFETDLWWAVQDSNLRHPACKAGALTN